MVELVDALERSALFRYTGMRKLLSFYRYFAFNLPRTVTASGIVALFGIAAAHAYLLIGNFAVPAYVDAYFAVVIAAAVVAAVLMVTGRRSGLTRIGWGLGSLVSVASVVLYVVAHTTGLPGLPQVIGRWAYPLGTFAMVMAALFVALHLTVVTRMNIAYPQRRDWHD